MKTYNITFTQTVIELACVTVEAPDEATAKILATERVEDGNVDWEFLEAPGEAKIDNIEVEPEEQAA